MTEWLDIALRAVIVLVVFLIAPLLVGQMEHKAMAHMQGRLGPMYAGGFHGWAQLVADGVKFAQKEDIIPAEADRRVFAIAPAIALLPYLAAFAAIPLTPTLVAADLNSGLLFVLAASAIGILGTVLAGWASGNKYSLLGGMRTAAQLLAYEVPMVLAASSAAILAGSLSLTHIADSFKWWWPILLAPGAVVFAVAAVAELTRPPFDIPIAESELVMGPYTEYTGLRFALFLLSEYAGIIVMSALFTVLFLGGHHGPGPEWLGPIWAIAKIAICAFVVIWIRVSWPRLRSDQLQALAWKVMIPVSLVHLFIVAGLVVAL